MTRVALVLVLLALICCAAFQVKIGAPARGLVKFTPPPVYSLWWAKDEECSGFTAPMSTAVSGWWYTANAEQLTSGKDPVDGFFLPASREIAIRGALQSSETLVRHEMLHAILDRHGITGHPAEYFVTRCHLVAG